MPQSNKVTVLICDDTPNWRDTLAAALEEEFNIVTATNKEETVQKLQATHTTYVALITDIRLNDQDPDNEDGLDLVELIRQQYPLISVIVITGYVKMTTARRALEELKAIDYLDKGDFDIGVFRSTTKRAVDEYYSKLASHNKGKQPITLLHLSDLHFSETIDPPQMLHPLVTDICDKEGLGLSYLNYLVISGDMTNRASRAEFEKARKFVNELMREFKLSPQQCIFVPGNHDLSWEEEVYKWRREQSVDIKRHQEGTWVKEGRGYLLREAKRYPQRFRNFVEYFFYPLVQRSYPLTFEEQFSTLLDIENKLQFLALNSCWEVDEHFPHRSSIHTGALARGLQQAQADIKAAIANQQIGDEAEVLRIAIWHHPVTGNEKIIEDAFLEQLQSARFKLCLHGHVHEDRTDLIGYMHSTHKIHIAGAGSFGAPSNSRPESTPRLYNLFEIAPDHSQVKVYTRSLRRHNGAWEGYAKWPKLGGTRHERSSFYVVNLNEDDSRIDNKTDSSSGNTFINTGGGSYISGDVNTGGGDFVGRDKKNE